MDCSVEIVLKNTKVSLQYELQSLCPKSADDLKWHVRKHAHALSARRKGNRLQNVIKKLSVILPFSATSRSHSQTTCMIDKQKMFAFCLCEIEVSDQPLS